MRKIIRIFVAVVFIISGFVKAVDPVGFSFKLEEYFSPSVFNMPFLEKLALPIAILVVTVELLLGVLLLLKIRIKRTLISLLAICIFFAFLTFYSAYFNVVTDCGCFGDALKMTPWTSFAKDMVLLVLIVILLKLYKHDESNAVHFLKSGFPKITLFLLSCIFLTVIVLKGTFGEPYIDFRDYKIGTDLKAEKAKIEANPSVYEVIYTLKNTKTGQEKVMSQDEYLSTNIWEDKNWQIESDKTKDKLKKQGYDSTIKNFKITDSEGQDITDKILNEPRVVIVFTYKPEKLSKDLINNIEAGLLARKSSVYAVSTQPDTFTKVPHGTMDGTAIKTIARSNPFVLILENGKIVFKQEAKDYFNN